MNDRERESALRDARKEVQLAESRVQDVSAKIADFRNREALLDPNKQSVPMLQAIVNLQSKLSSVKLEIAALQSSSPNSPLLASTRQRGVALQAQIDDAKSKITGTDSSLVPKIREFATLTLEREFADTQPTRWRSRGSMRIASNSTSSRSCSRTSRTTPPIPSGLRTWRSCSHRCWASTSWARC